MDWFEWRRIARAKDQQAVGLSQSTDDLIVVPVKTLAVPFLVLLLASAVLLARITRVRFDVGFHGLADLV